MFFYLVTICYVALRALLTLGLLRRSPRAVERPAVSVVVAARNEAAHLPALLADLLQQTYLDYEVIVVDDRSTDATPCILHSLQQAQHRLRIVRIDTLPPAVSPKMHALAHGIGLARGDLLLLTDADCRIPPTWVEGMVAQFAPDVGAVIGYVKLVARHGAVFEHLQALDFFAMMALAAGSTKLGRPLGASGANLGYRRSTYEAVGGFAAMPVGAVADDMLLLQSVWNDGRWRVVFGDDRRSYVKSHAQPTVQQFLHQRLRWMTGGQEVLQHNIALLTTSALIATVNGMLLGFPLFFLRPRWRRRLRRLIIARLGADLLHLGVAAWRFRETTQLRYFPLWLPAHMLGSNILSLYSLWAKWSWK